MTDAEHTHPAVERVEAALLEAGIEPRVRWFESATPTAVSAAAELGVEVGATRTKPSGRRRLTIVPDEGSASRMPSAISRS